MSQNLQSFIDEVQKIGKFDGITSRIIYQELLQSKFTFVHHLMINVMNKNIYSPISDYVRLLKTYIPKLPVDDTAEIIDFPTSTLTIANYKIDTSRPYLSLLYLYLIRQIPFENAAGQDRPTYVNLGDYDITALHRFVTSTHRYKNTVDEQYHLVERTAALTRYEPFIGVVHPLIRFDLVDRIYNTVNPAYLNDVHDYLVENDISYDNLLLDIPKDDTDNADFVKLVTMQLIVISVDQLANLLKQAVAVKTARHKREKFDFDKIESAELPLMYANIPYYILQEWVTKSLRALDDDKLCRAVNFIRTSPVSTTAPCPSRDILMDDAYDLLRRMTKYEVVNFQKQFSLPLLPPTVVAPFNITGIILVKKMIVKKLASLRELIPNREVIMDGGSFKNEKATSDIYIIGHTIASTVKKPDPTNIVRMNINSALISAISIAYILALDDIDVYEIGLEKKFAMETGDVLVLDIPKKTFDLTLVSRTPGKLAKAIILE